ncbi:alpha-amylase family glycosyl hydrolase [Blastopirellula sp. J2-11]|uniref:alpha-amylase family glycosyl hydrolase n=1 Tax=Blastopirellula sp. J2-11 TaxID=2943192 RepID=UPI0021C83F6D|nr:alpha-amylase family glycosyl hydrolase [Blastopirellula sp. J2-11]UUO06291.1 alpha-amylase family glycosyl hydrolase [Blastopirellula sp. J2-11]
METSAEQKLDETKHQLGMGAIPHENGTAFRVWAPNADSIAVVGEFNDWSGDANPMALEERGFWYADVSGAVPGQRYRFLIRNGEQELSRIDPYAREVTNSVGDGVIYDTHSFDWEEDAFQLPTFNELVIYEMHVGTFNGQDEDGPGGFADAIQKLDYLKNLGINAIELMPAAEFAGDYSWGYNPAQIFAVEGAYGGPNGLKHFVKEAHRRGIGVILDVVYNHFGPSDLSIWQFDGWSENGKGGIYFYNDWKSKTPWGDTRPDYGRGEVRQYIHDNALMWLEDYHVDGLRYDMTLFIRSVDGGTDLPEGWSMTRWINDVIRKRFPGRILIAEDLQNNEWLTKSPEEGGAGFLSQWDAKFVHPIRSVVTILDDSDRSMEVVRNALLYRYNGDAFQRVVYSESHDEVANGKARVVSEVSANHPHDVYAKRRSTLAAAMMFTAPGIPMLFQGQEFLQDGWFRDDKPLQWELETEFRGIKRLYRDLIHLRLNRAGLSRGLTGQNIDVFHLDDANKVIAFRRWCEGGPGDSVVVVANFANQALHDYRIGFPREGVWRLRLNSDAKVYSDDFSNYADGDPQAEAAPYDGQRFSDTVALAPYSFQIFSQDPA